MRIKLASVLLVGLLAVVAGCGGSSKSAAETTAETTTQAATTTTEAVTTTEETATTTEATETTTTEAAETTTSTGSSASFANAKNCAKLFGLSSEFAKAFGAANAKNDLQASAKFFEEFADKTPKDIRADFQVIAKAFSAYAKALDKAQLKPGATPTAQQLAELQKAASSFNQAAVTKANAHIQAWAQNNCHS